MLILDGGFTFANDRVRFYRAPTPSNAELIGLLNTLICTRGLPSVIEHQASTRGLAWARALLDHWAKATNNSERA